MFRVSFIIALIFGVLVTACTSPKPNGTAQPSFPMATQLDLEIGARKVVRLSQPQSSVGAGPQITSVDILPGRGMNIYQIRAYLPGKGAVDLFAAPPLDEARNLMNNGLGDEYGNQSFKIGGAILVPFANRIRGKLSADGTVIGTTILGKRVILNANWKGKLPKAEPHAMHGLLLGRAMDSVLTQANRDQASVTATLDAGDFGSQWLSKTALTITATLRRTSFLIAVTAKNTGNEDLPVGVGWHPYFVFPSGDRTQARLHIAAKERALVNNYDDVFPTGNVAPVTGTPYNFSVAGGATLGDLFLDDCFVGLEKDAEGHAIAEIIDPAAHYGIRVKGISPEISAFQVYAPVDKAFVALEPQFNWADPYNRIWKGKNTGMVVLKPGESVTYGVELELFMP